MTREEDIWQCSECGAEQGRHDMWSEGDICGDCKALKLTPEEVVKVQKFCDELRLNIKRDKYLNKISGGFCNVEFSNCDKNSIFLIATSGTSNDGTSYVTKDSYELDREDFEIMNVSTLSIKEDGIDVNF